MQQGKRHGEISAILPSSFSLFYSPFPFCFAAFTLPLSSLSLLFFFFFLSSFFFWSLESPFRDGTLWELPFSSPLSSRVGSGRMEILVLLASYKYFFEIVFFSFLTRKCRNWGIFRSEWSEIFEWFRQQARFEGRKGCFGQVVKYYSFNGDCFGLLTRFFLLLKCIFVFMYFSWKNALYFVTIIIFLQRIFFILTWNKCTTVQF